MPNNKTSTPLKWKPLGICGMDTAGLLIADPCYVIHQKDRDPKTLEIHDYSAWITCKKEWLPLKFQRGHEGAGIIVHSPNGDGSVTVYGQIDDQGAVRAVYFSFDGKEPEATL
jgi:hypothetical protein